MKIALIQHWLNLLKVATVALLFCCWFTSCTKPPSAANSAPATTPGVPPVEPTEVLISAAASTKELVELLASDFSKASNSTIKFNTGPSSGLATQIIAGAPADLFLSASREWATKVTEAGVAAKSTALLTNKLVLIVPQGNLAQVTEPQDLLKSNVKKIALAGEKVPAGKYADQVLGKLKLSEQLVAEQKIARAQDVRGALRFVERGEAEAGIVYSTDLQNTPHVEVVYEFDPTLHDEIVYVLVLLKHGEKNQAAVAFYEFANSADADVVYTKAGFSRIKP